MPGSQVYMKINKLRSLATIEPCGGIRPCYICDIYLVGKGRHHQSYNDHTQHLVTSDDL